MDDILGGANHQGGHFEGFDLLLLDARAIGGNGGDKRGGRGWIRPSKEAPQRRQIVGRIGCEVRCRGRSLEGCKRRLRIMRPQERRDLGKHLHVGGCRLPKPSRAAENECAHALGRGDSDAQGNCRAHGYAAKGKSAEAALIGKGEHVAGEGGDGEACRLAKRRAAMPAAFEGEAAVGLSAGEDVPDLSFVSA